LFNLAHLREAQGKPVKQKLKLVVVLDVVVVKFSLT